MPDHGLQKYPTLSTRIATRLKHVTGADLVFIGTIGKFREDGQTNTHRMFLNLKDGTAPYFRELYGPWAYQNYYAICAVTADLNMDDLDDLIVCDKKGLPHFYLQTKAGGFSEVRLTQNKESKIGHWRNVRVEKITGKGRPDLITVEGEGAGPYYLNIFNGKPTEPFFMLNKPYLSMELPHASEDFEILDANSDGIKDIYVSQTDEKQGYCAAKGGKNVRKFFPGQRIIPPDDWIPPTDVNDLLVFGTKINDTTSFQMSKMSFRGNGCGSFVRKFGDEQTLMVSRGNSLHCGYHYLLEWGPQSRVDRSQTTNSTIIPTTLQPTIDYFLHRTKMPNSTYMD